MSRTENRRRARRSRRGRILIGLGVPVGLIGSGLLTWQASYAAFSATTNNTSNQFTAGSVTIADNDGGSSAMFSTTTSASNNTIKPGDAGHACITVTYNGSLTPATKIQLYTTGNGGSTAAVASYLNLSIEMDTASSAGALAFTPNSSAGDSCSSRGGMATIYGSTTATNGTGNGGGAVTPTTQTANTYGTLGELLTRVSYNDPGATSLTTGDTYSIGTWKPSAAGEYRVFRVNWILPSDCGGVSACNTGAQGSAQSGIQLKWEVRSS
ncbi:hypothetical protein EV189_3804 [Motilibacter rhizosphaerae]|uniref:Uncharacterized protein n=1 Tax=Motilibacter rhizosphaerae TaxID=598652 RepID=A0A4Q7NAD9_9ACTN|nr:hypothetical protein [Motilibacter rhizosphaerae]RZS79450.1 hypothetical protein EV189_3804 [Motilibacter rhizosphaerae]